MKFSQLSQRRKFKFVLIGFETIQEFLTGQGATRTAFPAFDPLSKASRPALSRIFSATLICSGSSARIISPGGRHAQILHGRCNRHPSANCSCTKGELAEYQRGSNNASPDIKIGLHWHDSPIFSAGCLFNDPVWQHGAMHRNFSTLTVPTSSASRDARGYTGLQAFKSAKAGTGGKCDMAGGAARGWVAKVFANGWAGGVIAVVTAIGLTSGC